MVSDPYDVAGFSNAVAWLAAQLKAYPAAQAMRYFNVRLDEERTCVLVVIGATEERTKELLAVVDGHRESAQSWCELLQQLKRLGSPLHRS
jgi:hypothetical protein